MLYSVSANLYRMHYPVSAKLSVYQFCVVDVDRMAPKGGCTLAAQAAPDFAGVKPFASLRLPHRAQINPGSFIQTSVEAQGRFPYLTLKFLPYTYSSTSGHRRRKCNLALLF